MKVLIIGGAGYIGAHLYHYLLSQGCEVIVLDNLSTGHAEFVDEKHLLISDFANQRVLTRLLAQHSFDAVMHFAALNIVADSMHDPLLYYQHNIAKTLLLLQTLVAHGIRYFIFSSSAAVYGQPQYLPIDRDHPMRPINPYGMSKLVVENLLAYFSEQYGLHYASLRYFNAAGADPALRCGEWHQPETHLIPRLLQAILQHHDDACISIYGDQYPTRDGTCERDYIHVQDLARAHYLALLHLLQHQCSVTYNLGTGRGYTVKEVVQAVERVTGHSLRVQQLPPRPGDPAALIAKPDPEFLWSCERSDLHTIIDDAWRWEQAKALSLRAALGSENSILHSSF